MTRSSRALADLIELAKRRRDNRLQQLAESQRLAQQTHATLDSLNQFRDERLIKRRQIVGAPAQTVQQQVIEYRFDGKLLEAVDAQSTRCDQADTVRDERLQVANAAQNRVAALQLLARRRAARARQKLDKSEQRAIDEFVANAASGDQTPLR